MNPHALQRLSLFSSLPADQLAHLAQEIQTLQLSPNAILFREGEPGGYFYIVVEGELEVIQQLGTPQERLLRTVGVDDYVGEMSLFERRHRRAATVRARSQACLLVLSHPDFSRLLYDHPDFAYEVMRRMSLHLHEQDIAIIQELEEKNQELAQAYHELQNAQQQIIEKERLEHELVVAHQIQSSLLPRHVPNMHGFSFGFYIDPAHAVGGDFFDFIPLSTETLGLVVADVSDKGVPAAIFMALARSLVREKARRSTPPGRMLRNVNRQLMEMSDSDMFVTVLYGLLDATSRRFTYARAGHEMPLLFDGTGALLPLAHATGQALGLFEDPFLDEGSLIIPPGGLLLLHSDGVTDAMDPHNRRFGIEGIQAVLRQAAQAPADIICERIATAIAAHQERAAQFDDITLVAVRAD